MTRRDTGATPVAARNRRLMLVCVVVVAVMVGMSFASVPLYRLFCQVTGFGGATQRADKAPDTVLDRVVTVRFNADTDPSLPWSFRPAQREVRVRLGEQALAFYTARNFGHEPITGTATFNVTPEKVGGHFDKIQCFCFTQQTLAPGQSAELPVSFFVDPSLAKDPNLDDIKVITLSYTFFRARKPEQPRVSAAPGGARPVN
ncbi:MAG: cytochrome c oxidase assembly protein [Alphaproteobacteria bacterium]|nr:cytochrome c oxidase assembly protein [Alphaproteobacteria bacterium]